MKETKIVFFIGITMIILLFVIYFQKPESNFRGGGGRGGRGRGGRGRGWAGYGWWGYPGYYYGLYDSFDNPVIVNQNCPDGFVYRGEKEGCKKLSEIK